MSSSTPAEHYWLLAGETPTGPFRTEEILSQIQSGTCTWTTKAIRVGSTEWVPLNQLLTLAPVAQLAVPEEGVACAISANASRGKPKYTYNYLALFVSLLVLGLVGYCLYSSYLSTPAQTPQQVCWQLSQAKTLAEARRLVTPAMYRVLEIMYAQPDDPTVMSNWELSAEQPAPTSIGGYYVRFRFQSRDAQSHDIMDGVFHLIKQSGWKINDMILMTVNQQEVQPPLSFAREYEFLLSSGNATMAPVPNNEAKQQAKQWYSSQMTRPLTQTTAAALANKGFGKWLMLILIAVGASLLKLFRTPTEKQTTTTSHVSTNQG